METNTLPIIRFQRLQVPFTRHPEQDCPDQQFSTVLGARFEHDGDVLTFAVAGKDKQLWARFC